MKEVFYTILENHHTHRRLLYEALIRTPNTLVLELGMGSGSSQVLHDFCEKEGRVLYSYEGDAGYFSQYKHLESKGHVLTFVKDWEAISIPPPNFDKVGVALVDHIWQRRNLDSARLKKVCDVVVLHDVEPWNDNIYNVKCLFDEFKYCVIDRYCLPVHSFWTAALSDTIDVSAFPHQCHEKVTAI